VSFFKSIGKLLKKVSKIALPVLKLGTSFIPGVGGAVSGLLNSKLGRTALNLSHKAKQTGKLIKSFPGVPPPQIAPVAATTMMHAKLGRHAHKIASHAKKRTKKATKKRRSVLRKRTTTKRRSSGRKLKFGSPAWRKKYIKKRR